MLIAPHQPKTFIDKIADALLGGDEQSPNNKYALICQKCFSHNGLCLKDEVMDVREFVFFLSFSFFHSPCPIFRRLDASLEAQEIQI